MDRSIVQQAKPLSLVPQNMPEALQFAEALSKSTIIPREYQDKAANILVAMLQGMELGLGPLQSLHGIAVINGRPSVWGDAMLAVIQGSGLLEKFEETQDEKSATCTVKRRGVSNEITRTFTVEDAKKANLWGKQGPWSSYPKRMMQMRARAFALRDGFADVLRGIHSAEEVSDYDVEVIESKPAQIKGAPKVKALPPASNQAEEAPPFGEPRPLPKMNEGQQGEIKAICQHLGIDSPSLGAWLKETLGKSWNQLSTLNASEVLSQLQGLSRPNAAITTITQDQFSLIKSLASDLKLSPLDLELRARDVAGVPFSEMSKAEAEELAQALSEALGDLVGDAA